MCNATDDPQREARHVESLLGKRVDGIVVTGRRADLRRPLKVDAPGLPVVYVYSRVDDPNALSLLPDDRGGAVLACEHLIALARRRIAHVTGPERFEAVRLRRAGYRATLAGAGLKVDDKLDFSGEWSEVWGRASLEKLFRTRRGAPDAIFCGNDQIARGVADGLRERGLQVPRDVAVVGFDNWQVIAEACRPPLTTIDMNLKALGREAGSRLIELIGGKRHTGVHRLPCSLVVRESCGAASA
jgi:LacI family transcriptional regulator